MRWRMDYDLLGFFELTGVIQCGNWCIPTVDLSKGPSKCTGGSVWTAYRCSEKRTSLIDTFIETWGKRRKGKITAREEWNWSPLNTWNDFIPLGTDMSSYKSSALCKLGRGSGKEKTKDQSPLASTDMLIGAYIYI